MARKRLFLCFVVLSLVFLSPHVSNGYQSDDFEISQIFPIERGHSYVGFSIKYMGFAKVRGRFTDFSGTFRYDDKDLTKSSVTAIIRVASIDTDHDFRDRDLKSDNWFDAEKYPLMRFQSKQVVKTGSSYEMIGDLTIKDVTKEVRIRLEEISGTQKDVREDTQVVITGRTTIDRKDFGVAGENWSRIKEGITAVASEVEIELSILGKRINAPNFRNWVRNPQSPQGKIYQIVTETGLESGLSEFRRLKSEAGSQLNPSVLNTVGYMLLKEGRSKDALEVFKHNAEAFPDDPNVYDSLGEAYATQGDKKNAARAFNRSLEKDPLNANAMEILRHLGTVEK